MAGVLHLQAGGQALEAGLQARSAALRGLGGPGVTLDASDKVWADPTLPTERTYLNAIATGYDAGLATALDPIETSPDPFTTAAGRQVTAQFMIGGPYRAVSAGGWTAVQLPYRGGKLDMEALLPPAGPAAAHFTGLSPQACCIPLVEHAATLGIGEKGTVASAATAVGAEATAGQVLPPQVRFNRPYLMVVTDRTTGEPCSWPGSPTQRHVDNVALRIIFRYSVL